MTERIEEGIASDGRPRHRLQEPLMWFSLVVLGMLAVFAGLVVDAYKHDHGANEEALLSLGNPGHVIAGIGLAVASLAALSGLSMSLIMRAGSVRQVTQRVVPLTAAWVTMAAVVVGSITYIGATGVTVGHSHGGSELAVATAEHEHPPTVAAAAGSATTNVHAHDAGVHPTLTQVLTKTYDELSAGFPAGTMNAADFPLFAEQVKQVRGFTTPIKTIEDARAAGYTITTGDIPYMGQHWLNFDLVSKGVFDPARPHGLLFAKVDGGDEQLVGAWFLMIPGLHGTLRDTAPEGFAGDLDVWHAHVGLCFTSAGAATEGETKESCDAKGGLSYSPDLRWMMHAWVVDGQENPDGVFHYLNGDLYKRQVAAGNTNPPLESEGSIAP